jgi:hypothetical protein
VPRVSAFYGIVIRMHFNEDPHPGRPHFHAEYAGARATFDLETLELIVGHLPRRSHRLVLKWARLHQGELRHNWRLLRSRRPLLPIAPLP